ncbi:MAG: hypothetical protein JWM35_491 [Verrucomicrobia bacterium]|nr:hypothetical protein [Verrucomicrobiota bacterium]
MSSVAASTTFRKITGLETVALLAIAWLIPFMVHVAPWSGPRPLGAYLLPMFWATFVAVYFFGIGPALLTALFAPAINLVVTGLPAWKFLSVVSFELVIFACVLTWAVRRAPRFWLLAPLGYLVAKTASTLLQAATPVFGNIGAPAAFFVSSIVGVVAGLVILAAINFALVKFYPKDARTGP